MRQVSASAAALDATIDPDTPETLAAFLRDVNAAWSSGDIDWALEHTAEDIEIVQPPALPDARTYEGRAGFIEALLDWPLQWENFSVEPQRTFALDNETVVTVATHRGRSMHYGIDVEGGIVWVTRWESEGSDRRMSRWDMYLTVEEAQAAFEARCA
jgi:ketosteroid isomerase-like protein